MSVVDEQSYKRLANQARETQSKLGSMRGPLCQRRTDCNKYSTSSSLRGQNSVKVVRIRQYVVINLVFRVYNE